MRTRSTALAVLLASALALPLPAALFVGDKAGAPPAAAASETELSTTATEHVSTKVEGLKRSLTRTRAQKAVDKVSVTPAWGRKVELQYRDPATRAWQTVRTWKTANKRTATVKISYGKNWKSHMKSTWRLRFPSARIHADGSQIQASSWTGTVRIMLSDAKLSCKAALVMDAKTGELIFDYNARKRRKVASMTKMMTALLLVENKSLKSKVKVSGQAARTPWGIGLRTGDTVTAKNLLYAMMLPSANDAATASGIAVSGSSKAFAKLMTRRAAELGCEDTVYKNAHGLDRKNAHSTALDQGRIARQIMTGKAYGAIRRAVRTKSKRFTSKRGLGYQLASTDKLLKAKGVYRSFGVKTGTTDDAGCCFAGAFRVGGRLVITVELGAKSDAKRWSSTRELVRIASYASKHDLPRYEL